MPEEDIKIGRPDTKRIPPKRKTPQQKIDVSKRKLTLKQRRFVREYLRTGNATQSALAAYDTTKRNAAIVGSHTLRIPQVALEIRKALEKEGLDEFYVSGTLKKIIDAGVEGGLEDADVKDSLKGLDMIVKLQGYSRSSESRKDNSDGESFENMDIKALEAELIKLDKQQRAILDAVNGKIGAEEGEVVNE